MEEDWGFCYSSGDWEQARIKDRYAALKRAITLDGLIARLEACRAQYGGNLRVIDSFDHPLGALQFVFYDGKRFYLEGEPRPKDAQRVGLMLTDE